ncbi:MAG: hypothetical protein KDD11_16850 [Acidobacteria bacterium]|nr:hypothetical protein [Acidobacteriota bacterium]
MELPADVMIHNGILGLKGTRGVLLRIDPHGYYEVNLAFGERRHRTLLPIETTVIIHRQPEDDAAALPELEIER